MRKVIIAVAALLLWHPAARAGTEEGIIEKVQARFQQTHGMTASFTQTFHNAAMGTVEKSSGTLVLQKPMKMRWEYQTPKPQTIVCDGRRIWFYFPREKQAMSQEMKGVLNSGSPALFLAGGRRLDELFNIKFLPGGGNGGTIPSEALSLTPKEQALTITKIVVRWAEDFTVRAFTIYDWTGNKSEVELTDIKVNPSVDEKAFKFSPPQGVEVLEAPKF